MRDQNLASHEIHAGDHFSHGVLDLDAGIDLDEIELAGLGIQQELDRAGVVVFDRLADPQGGVADGLPHFGHEVQGGGDLDHFLMPSLERAVTLIEVHQVAVLVAEQLDFDVAGFFDELLQVQPAVAEVGGAEALDGFEGLLQGVLRVAEPHPNAAASGSALQHHGIADVGRFERSLRNTPEQCCSGQHGRSTAGRDFTGGVFQPEGADMLGARANEGEAAPALALISGTVKDEAGRPLAGAVVALLEAVFNGRELKSVKTDSEGKFTAEMLPGVYRLRAAADGFRPVVLARIELEQAAKLTYDFALKRVDKLVDRTANRDAADAEPRRQMRVGQRELDRGRVVADQFLNPSLYLAIQRHAGRKRGGFDIVHDEKYWLL